MLFLLLLFRERKGEKNSVLALFSETGTEDLLMSSIPYTICTKFYYQVINAVAALVPENHKVNLSNPTVVILVDIHKV